MLLFSSTYTNKVDKKGRVSVPASFRAALPDDDPAVSILPSLVCKAVEGFKRQYLHNVNEKIDTFDLLTNPGQPQGAAAEIISRCITVNIDNDGRIVLPRNFLKYAGITNSAIFEGLGSSFRIWSPAAYEAARTPGEGA